MLRMFERSFNLLERLRDSKQNIMISPLSIDMALKIIMNGLCDEAREELESYFGSTLEVINKTEIDRIKQYDDSISLANSFWVKQDNNLVINNIFKSILDKYNAEIGTIGGNPEPINAWVSNKTHGRITHIIDELDRDTLMILVNAIYFKGKWKSSFNEDKTYKGKFSAPDGNIECSMMVGEAESYFENEQAIGFAKYYDNGYRFLSILPKDSSKLSLNEFNFDRFLLSENWGCNVKVIMPRFKSDYSISLIDKLSDIGLEKVFKTNAVSKAVSEPGTISEILHKTEIEVSESGTVASATTMVGMVRGCSLRVPKLVRLDKPFIYIIQDKNGNIVFMGELNKPN